VFLKKPVIACETVLFNAMDLCGPQTGVDFWKHFRQHQQHCHRCAVASAGGRLYRDSDGGEPELGSAVVHAAASATVVSIIPNQPAQATIFCYEAGAPLYDAVPAPDRRVGMLLKMEVALNLNENGWKLFDAAVNWCLRL